MGKVDVVAKFYYLEHGKEAPKNSGYKGIISTRSIVGFKSYTERKASKEMSAKGKEEGSNFFSYTTSRFGAQKTFSSNGWLDTNEKNNDFKKLIESSFFQDGDLIWAPIISLSDFMTAYQMKLFNEEDYASIFTKILPDWFQKCGFENDNMSWWLDYHVNTDNPHIHLNFFEKSKIRDIGKLSMKDINNFKNSFWNEVFAKQRYLEKTGNTAEAGFRNKDILKQETFKLFKQNLKTCTDKDFINNLKNLYNELPTTGRLQYNSSHMIPYRKKIDEVVNQLLLTPSVQEKYLAFKNCLKEFDQVRNSNMHSRHELIYKQEDQKLRILLANEILREFKTVDHNYWENEISGYEDVPGTLVNTKFILPVANSLVSENGNLLFVRIPRMHMVDRSGPSKYIELRRDQTLIISEVKMFRLAEITADQQFKVYDRNYKETGEILSAAQLNAFFDDGKEYLETWKKMINWEQKKYEWTEYHNDWKGNANKLQRASFSWMNQIENEVANAQEEYLIGREMI